MALADYLVAAVLIEGRPVADVAADHGVSRSWLYELLARYREQGDDGLRPRSRRPHHSPTRTAAVVFDGTGVLDTFKKATRRHGEPASLLTDNGGVFTAKAVGGHNALETHLAARGIKAIHSRPYHPQTCGKVERIHQTEKNWLA